MRRRIRLTESDIHRIVRSSVNRILQEVTMNGTTSPYTNDFANDNRIAAHGYTHNSANMPDPSYDGIKNGDYYAAPNRDSSSMHKDIDNFNKKQKKNTKAADKRWQTSADSRNLWRKSKGALNGAFEESRIRSIVRETLKRTLNEGGHLYGHDEDGTPFTNSKETYRGVPGSTYIWHGEWSDPEIWYDGVELNANDVEEGLWYSYKDDCEENGEQPTEQGYEQWLEEMGVDWIESQLQDYAWSAQGNP